MGHPRLFSGVERRIWVPHSSRLYRDEWGSGTFAAGPGPVRFDFDRAAFAVGPMVEAAPWPVFRLLDETASDRIAVDVYQLLDPLCVSENVEVVIAGLPELRPRAFEEFGRLSFEGSKRVVEAMQFWFAEEQVDVLRHQDVGEHIELVATAESFQHVQEDDSGVIVVEVGEPVIATEGQEMIVTFSLVTL